MVNEFLSLRRFIDGDVDSLENGYKGWVKMVHKQNNDCFYMEISA